MVIEFSIHFRFGTIVISIHFFIHMFLTDKGPENFDPNIHL